MLIVIPSFKRTDILPLVLGSIINSDVSTISEEIKILIVNNFYPNRLVIKNIISHIKLTDKYVVLDVHREVTLPGIDSWYMAINDYALEGEVVILLGDDDLMMPCGIASRYEAIKSKNADMLISDYEDRIYFFNGGKKYWLTKDLSANNLDEIKAVKWDFFPAKHPEPSFMSNHCYRNTPVFRSGLKIAFEWCDTQYWLDRSVRTAMLPFYLPYAISVAGGSVLSLSMKCVLRGAVAEESIKVSYADGGNTDFYNLCALNVFNNHKLPLYNQNFINVIERFKPAVISGVIKIFIDKNISLEVLRLSLKNSGLRFKDFLTPAIYRGFRDVLIKAIGMRGARLRIMKYSSQLKDSNKIIDELNQSNSRLRINRG